MKIASAFIFLMMNLQLLFAQSNADLQLLQNHFSEIKTSTEKKSNHFIASKSPLTLPFRAALFFYQRIISPQWNTDCIHSPSCSNFSKQSILRFGLIKGVALSADRLMRCTPLALRNYPNYQFDIITGKIDDSPQFYYWKNRFLNR